VRTDATLIVLNSGNHEFVAVRHRESQTLYLSDLIRPATCKDPAYGKLHVGIYIAAVNDAMRRVKLLPSKGPGEQPVLPWQFEDEDDDGDGDGQDDQTRDHDDEPDTKRKRRDQTDGSQDKGKQQSGATSTDHVQRRTTRASEKQRKEQIQVRITLWQI
jgi:hypothetical protein